jgi:hypothetical protein
MSTSRLSLRTAFALALGCFATGCIGDDEAIIFVEPVASAPEGTLITSPLGSAINGSFQLRLILGPRASGTSKVTIGSVNITDVEGKTTIVPSLSLTTKETFPLDVPPSSDINIDVTYDLGDKTIPMTSIPDLCAPTGVAISGTINDSLQTAATPFLTESFMPMGCP